jgi:hypothetical protein
MLGGKPMFEQRRVKLFRLLSTMKPLQEYFSEVVDH